ncbi:hypothetical protein QYE76_033734 [Lolium multiflorum]|uniref:Uncharacterized protein n=1 Tax=Lolium multiflorum TaxID=4521 RepID=A0AAD8QXL4_LOLMU|nr:hypothetical protein QYE76_033734 [Lolium multiflorum]
MLSPTHLIDSNACTAWALRLLTKMKILSYLPNIDKLGTRANLFFKNCAPSDVCDAFPSIETGRHMFFDYRLATGVWARLGVVALAGHFSFWDLQPP